MNFTGGALPSHSGRVVICETYKLQQMLANSTAILILFAGGLLNSSVLKLTDFYGGGMGWYGVGLGPTICMLAATSAITSSTDMLPFISFLRFLTPAQ